MKKFTPNKKELDYGKSYYGLLLAIKQYEDDVAFHSSKKIH